MPSDGPGIELPPAREATTPRRPAAGESSRVTHHRRVRRPAAGSPGRPSGRPVSSNALFDGPVELARDSDIRVGRAVLTYGG
jgi:hypothetical protein